MRAVLAIFLSVSACTYAQSVISAHSGVVQYVEGDVSIDGQAIQPKFAEFPDVKADQVISTGEGRVELLLTPGVFLRLAENSSVRMISNSLSDTRLAMVSGSALVEVAELLPNNAIKFDASGTEIALRHKGLYRIDSEPARLRVYDGQANAGAVAVHKGHEVALDTPALTAASFDTKDIDGFYRWSARRSEYVAEANLTSARVANNPLSSGYVGGVSTPNGMWSWNPWFGMFTYLPGSGMYMSPFGSTYYSPMMASSFFVPVSGYIGGVPIARTMTPTIASAGGMRSTPAMGPGVHAAAVHRAH